MKPCLITLIVSIGLFTGAFGQSAHSAIDSLVKYQIITAKGRLLIEKNIKNRTGVSYRVAILAGLEDILIQKTFHIDPHKMGGFSYSYSYEKGINKKSRDSINTTLRLVLKKINRAGLLTNRVYAQTSSEIDSSAFIVEVQMIGHLVEMSSRLEWLTPNKLLPVAEQLHNVGIVSDSAFVRLKNDINSGKIESSFQLNNYCKFDREFSLEKYPNDSTGWLEHLHHDIASMLPGLSFTDFRYTTSLDSALSTPSLPEIKYKVSLVCNKRTYKYTTTVLAFKMKDGKIHFSDFAVSFYRIFNKILTDEQSTYRLHLIMPDYRASSENYLQNFSLIALTDSQAGALWKKPAMSYMMVSMEGYDNTLTSVRIDSTITEWKSIGLFSHLSEAQINKAIDDAVSGDLFSIDHLLFNFPQVVYSLDSAMRAQDHTYIGLLNHLAGLTHGAFNPTRITQRKVKGGVKLQYLSGGKIHYYIFNTEYGWFDHKFPQFVTNLRQENNLVGNFYFLPYENAIIYLTLQQHDYIVGHKLLDFDEPTYGNKKNKFNPM